MHDMYQFPQIYWAGGHVFTYTVLALLGEGVRIRSSIRLGRTIDARRCAAPEFPKVKGMAGKSVHFCGFFGVVCLFLGGGEKIFSIQHFNEGLLRRQLH